jgi:hypothetical protein
MLNPSLRCTRGRKVLAAEMHSLLETLERHCAHLQVLRDVRLCPREHYLLA